MTIGEHQRLTRRGFLASGAVIAAGLAEAQVASAAPISRRHRPRFDGFGDGDWPTAGHDLSATRFASRLAGADVLWTADFPGGVPATAAIARRRVYAASGAGAVAALDLSDGTMLWEQQLGTAEYGSGADARELGFFGAVAVAGRSVIAASDRVYALDAETGATRWVTTPLRTSTSDDYFWGAPVVVGGLVLVGSGSGAELPTARGRLTAYRLSDGELVWSTATVPAGANGGGIIGPPSVDPWMGVAYIATGAPYAAVSGSNPGTCSLFALRLHDGGVLWQDQVFPDNQTGFDFNSAPVIVGRRLFATNKDGIYAWDRVSRRRLWSTQVTDPLAGGVTSAGPTGGPEGGPIATDGQRIYVLSNDIATSGGVAAALEPANGRVVWQTPLPAPSFGAPAVAGDLLCVPASDGTVSMLNTRNGTIVTVTSLPDPSSAAAAVADGRLVVGTGAAPFLPGTSLVCIG
jgi:outer membrane protein assembly factor BamB